MKRIIISVALALAFCLPVYAEEPEYKDAIPEELFEQQMDASGAEELWDMLSSQTKGYLSSIGVEDISVGSMLALQPSQFFHMLTLMAKDTISRPQVLFLSILGVILLCSVIGGFKEGFLDKSLGGVFSTVSVLCIVASVVAPVIHCIDKASRAIYDCSNFMLSFVPVLSGIMAVSGQPTAASTYNMFLFAASEVTAQIAANTVVPLLGIFLAFCVVSGISPHINLSATAQFVKSIATWVLGFIVTAFVALLSIQTMVSTGVDNVAVKAGKFIIGSFVPVVGGALADAMTSVGGCLMLLKSVVGVFGILASAVIFLPVLLESLVWLVTLKAAAALSDIFDIKPIGEVLKGFATAISLLVTVILCFAVLIIVATTITLVISAGVTQ